MNEIESEFNIYLWTFDAISLLLLMIIIVTFCFTFLHKLKKDEQSIKNFYANELGQYNLKFITKKNMKFNIIMQFYISNILFLAFFVLVFLKFIENKNEINVNQFLIQIIIYPLAFLFANLFLVIMSFYVYKNKKNYELSDQEILKLFLKFKEEWIRKNGNQKINLKKNSIANGYYGWWYTDWYFWWYQKNNIKMLRKNKVHFKKTYEIREIELFRRNLIIGIAYINNSFNDSSNKNQQQSIIKFSLIHNFLCDLDNNF